MALLHVLVGALQDRLLLQAGHGLLLLNTAEAGLGVLLAAAEVDPALLDKIIYLRSQPDPLPDKPISDQAATATVTCYQLIT